MKRAIALFFLTAYLLSSTELGQLLKIPVFASHFVEHQQQNKDITLWEFICIHYAQGDVKDADYETDRKLPFKTHDNCGTQHSCTIPPSLSNFPIEKIVHVTSRMKYFVNDVSWTSSFLSQIWQPPKSC